MSVVELQPETLPVDAVVDAAGFDALRDEWNALAGDVPFRQWEWADSWWRHYRQPNHELFVLTQRDATGRLLALAPFFRSRELARGRVIRWLGSGNTCSDHLTLLADVDRGPALARQMADWLGDAANKHWSLLELDGVDTDDATTWALVDQLAEHDYAVERRHRLNTWRIALPATWDEYLARLSKSRRERARSLARRNFDTGRCMPRLAETIADFEYAWPHFKRLHQQRRQSLGQRGAFSLPGFEPFHDEVARRYFDRGLLRLHWIEVDGHPIAAEYAFVGGDTVYYYQAGFDPAAAADRPGWLEVIASIKRAIAEGYHTFDFLRGDEPYKASWRAEPLQQWHVRIYGRGAASQARRWAWNSAAATRRWIKRRLGLNTESLEHDG